MTQLKDGGRQPSNREERSLSASTVIARWQGNGWDEPCKSRGLRTVLWAAGGEIPPADPAAWNPALARHRMDRPAGVLTQVRLAVFGAANILSSARMLMTVHRPVQTHGPFNRAAARSSGWRIL